MRRADRRRETKRLTDAINTRLRAYEDDRDAAHLSDEQALADAAALIGLHGKVVHGGALQARFARILFGGFARIRAILTLTDFYWARYKDESIGGGREDDDYYAAASLYSVIFYVDRDRVPAQLHDLLLTAEAHKGIGPDDWAERAIKLTRSGWSSGDPEVLAKALSLARMALALLPEGEQRNNLAGLLGVIQTYRLEVVRASRQELDLAITAQYDVVAAASAGEDKQVAEYILAGLLGIRFERTGAMGDLDEALRLVGRLVETHDSELRATAHSARANFLTRRFEVLGDPHDIEAAVQAGRLAVDMTAEDDPDLALCQNNLGMALAARHVHHDDADDLDEAITVGRRALRTSGNRSWTVRHQANLSHYLILRYNRTGSLDDLEEAIELGGSAIEQEHVGGASRSRLLSNMSSALVGRYHALGRVTDLNRAIEMSRESITITPAGDFFHTLALVNLGQALLVRFEATGMIVDLNDSIEVSSLAAETATTMPFRFQAYTCLAWAMGNRYNISDDSADVRRGAAYHQRAIESSPEGSPNRMIAYSNLCAAHLGAYAGSKSIDDLDKAVEAGEQAVAIELPGAPHRGMCLTNLGTAYTLRFDATQSRADIERAVTVCQQAWRVTPTDHPSRAGRMLNAGRALLSRSELTGDPSDLVAALELLRQSSMSGTAPANDRIAAAETRGAALAAAGRWREAADALRHAVTMLPLVAMRGIERADGERLMTGWPGLASDAAACAINAGDDKGAIEVLENGRAVLWSQWLDAESDLSLLRSSHPALAEELASIGAVLNRRSDPVVEMANGTANQARADQAVRLAHRWDELVTHIRTLPGFESFLVPVSADTILATLRASPVVILNVSRWRCDAIVIRDGQISVVGPLPCTYDEVVNRMVTYVNSFGEYEERKPHIPTRLKVEEMVETTLDWLWTDIVAPVLDELGHVDEPDPGQQWPRVWWCPTGPLTLLPVHAAGRGAGGIESALTRVVSSYTPTLRALRSAPSTVATEDAGLLVVAVSEADGLDPLDSVEAEVNMLKELLATDRIEILEGPRATRRAVTTRMRGRSFVHLSCHGSQDLMNPSQACIFAHDGPLTLAELASSHGGGELVTLSACMTATGGAAAADEVVSLAAALYYTGWRQVVATLWWVWDDAASEIMTNVYRRIVTDGTIRPEDAALALHQAVREHRTAHPHLPTRWAPFIHIGP